MIKKILREHRLLIGIYLATGIIVSILSTYGVHLFQLLLNGFTDGSLSLAAIAVYGGVTAAGELLAYFDNYPHAKLDNSIYLSFKLFALQKMSTLQFTAYQKLGTGQLSQRIENGAQAGRSILYEYYFRLFRELLPNVAFSLIFIAGISRPVLLAVGIGYIVVFLVTKLLLRYLYKFKERILVNEEFLNRRLIRGFMELVVFRTNRRFASELAEAKTAAGEITDAKTKILLIHEAFFTLFALLVTAIKVVILVYGFLTRTLTVGEIVALITFLDKAYQPIAIFNVLYVQYKLDRVAYGRFTEIMELPDDRRLTSSSSLTVPELTGGAVCFHQARYSYGTRTVLQGVSLSVPAGTSAALVGESGSGKSTLLKLLTGLLVPEEGSVSVDGFSLSEADLNRYYEQIAYVSQDAPVFDGTLRENLVFDRAVPDEELFTALKQVELSELVEKLPDGLNTQLGERGTALSGGERQRLALARLWFSEARLVILDEATSALDTLTEEAVMANVLSRLDGRTVVAVAHRLKTISGCGRIYAMQNGAVVEEGSFSELMARGGYFAGLWQAGLREEAAANRCS